MDPNKPIVFFMQQCLVVHERLTWIVGLVIFAMEGGRFRLF